MKIVFAVFYWIKEVASKNLKKPITIKLHYIATLIKYEITNVFVN